MASLNVTIVGAGAIGSMLGGIIKHEGKAMVNFVGRKPHMEAIDKNGLTIEFVDENKKIDVSGFNCYTDISDVKSTDVLIFSVKAFDLEGALYEAKHLLSSPSTTIILAMNGLGIEELAGKYVERERLVRLALILPCKFEPGKVKSTGANRIIFVEDNPFQTIKIRPLFETELFYVEFVQDIAERVWKKTVLNLLNPVSAIFGRTVGEILSDSYLMKLVELMVEEYEAVARKLSLNIWDSFDFLKRTAANDKEHYTSMYFDLKKDKPTEIDFLNGFIALKGEEVGVPTKINLSMTLLIKKLTKKSKIKGRG